MQYVTAQDFKIPALGFGTWELKGKECESAVLKALETGYRHIDTAQAYGNEFEVGNAIAQSDVPREDIFLVTKIWMDHFNDTDFEKSLDESLNKLQTDKVDLLLLHWPSTNEQIEDTLERLIEVKKAGKTNLIGVSNYTIELMGRAVKKTDGLICTNQIEFHPMIEQGPVYEWAIHNDMFITGYSPLARGNIMQNQVIEEIAKAHNKTPGQVTLRWAIQHDQMAVIPKSGTDEHIEENFDIFDFELSEQDMNRITALSKPDGRQVDPEFAPDWDTANAA